MAINLRGLLLPVTTPFTAAEEIDADGLTANLEKWNRSGLTGYVALGSTGERVNLNEREYLRVIETARLVVPETLTFIAGAGQQSTRGTIAEIEKAARAGAEVRANAGPPGYVYWQNLPTNLTKGKPTSAGVNIEIVPGDDSEIKLVVPVRNTNRPGEE